MVLFNMKNNFKKKIIFLTFIFLFVSIAFLTPFIAIEGASKTLGFIIVGILTFIYLFILIAWLWDWYKSK